MACTLQVSFSKLHSLVVSNFARDFGDVDRNRGLNLILNVRYGVPRKLQMFTFSRMT